MRQGEPLASLKNTVKYRGRVYKVVCMVNSKMLVSLCS